MNNIPKKLRRELERDPDFAYKGCLRRRLLHDHNCAPHPMTRQLIEWEHAFIYAGKQVQEKWAIIPICWWAHSGPGLNKEINQWIALNRASDEDLEKYSKAINLKEMRERLNKIYGFNQTFY